ncbi:Vitamin B12 import ATP-binding protein BtuD [Paenibacillus plantiphilus]|uniref:Vitamin B12 import ATP-binding protein BtuD n=1 Tax=Paenibacillus plantiphilus TaxID=2905650 RepID=A0ABN8FYS1_9BACL|nr:ABC transporter ATP-binding protein [Paenibacillus plantiphilus]CAH1195150.1 Vitamin B12 import ATP-binding protein BtuD [Paenibacillus plantiphilus]
MDNVLELRNVSQVYVNDSRATLAVEDLSLTVERGSFLSLVGPSGCGKTTILSMLAGLLKPTKGEVVVGGEIIQGPSARIGYMLQHDYLFPWRTILDNALLGLELGGRRTEQGIDYTRSLLHELGLGGFEKRMPHELSGGMRQRAALVRTLATEPDVLLLDEPFSALDMGIKLQLEDLVQSTLRSKGKTAVLVTHDLAEAAAMSDQVVVLARNPGRYYGSFLIPPSIRDALPTEARRMREFQSIFDSLWRSLEESGEKGGASHGQELDSRPS